MMEKDMPKFPDDARRIADEMTMHAIAKSEGWVAFWLADGRPVDHVPYSRRQDAVRACKWDKDNVLYLEIQPDGMPIKYAVAVLQYARMLHSAGFRIPDPEFDYDASMPIRRSDRIRQIRHLASGGKN